MIWFIIGLLVLHSTSAHHGADSNQCRDEEKKLDLPTENAAREFERLNAVDGIQNTTELIFVSNSKIDYFPCPGVLLSKIHVLISRHCNAEVNSKIAVGYKADLVKKTEEFINRTVAEVLNIHDNAHMVILKLTEEIPEDHTRKILKLPSKSCEYEVTYTIKGWSFTPDRVKNDDIFYDTFLIHEGDVEIVMKKDCPFAVENECCIRLKATEKEFKMMIGSPVIKDDYIIGFAHFDCEAQGAMSLVFPWVEEIKKLIS